MESAAALALGASGVFFMVGLLTGVWKYRAMWTSQDGTAHYYVDTAHRASLLYAFAALILYQFAVVSEYPQWLEVAAVGMVITFFWLAIASYVVHGILKDTDNQFRAPHVLGRYELPPFVLRVAMWALIIGEFVGFGILFVGFLEAVVF